MAAGSGLTHSNPSRSRKTHAPSEENITLHTPVWTLCCRLVHLRRDGHGGAATHKGHRPHSRGESWKERAELAV